MHSVLYKLLFERNPVIHSIGDILVQGVGIQVREGEAQIGRGEIKCPCSPWSKIRTGTWAKKLNLRACETYYSEKMLIAIHKLTLRLWEVMIMVLMEFGISLEHLWENRI